MKAHFFDLDTILRIDNKVWIIDKKNPNNPIKFESFINTGSWLLKNTSSV